MTVKRRPCERCQINRAERFYVSERGRVCAKCRSGAQKRAAKTAMLRNTYNITYDEWEAIIAAQGIVRLKQDLQAVGARVLHIAQQARLARAGRMHEQVIGEVAAKEADVFRRVVVRSATLQTTPIEFHRIALRALVQAA